MSPMTPPPDGAHGAALAVMRRRLAGKTGRVFWRSLDELGETEEFQRYLKSEFPAAATIDPVNRRDFIRLMGASLALAGLTGCTRQPKETIVPRVRAPEDRIPGKPQYFATSMPFEGIGRGLLVESHSGRPTKVEGNPMHPESQGACDAILQASILSLYDPDRSQVIRKAGRISTWSAFLAGLNPQRLAQEAIGGAGLRILTGALTSPSQHAGIQELLTRFPEARWHQHEPAARDAFYDGAALAFGEKLETRYDFTRADRIVSLDADFLYQMPGSLRYSRDFAARRDPAVDARNLNRLYMAETTVSVTGANADHRLPLSSAGVADLAHLLAAELGVETTPPPAPTPALAAWARTAAADLLAHRGRSLVLAGRRQPAELHALAHAMNAALGNIGETVTFTEPVEPEPANKRESLRALVADMRAGKVQVLILLDVNPVYDAPADLDFAQALDQVPYRAQLAPYYDETADLCHWHVPLAHYLESWGDVRAFDGTAAIVQPLIDPLYESRSVHQVLGALLGRAEQSTYDVVRDYWRDRLPAGDFETAWRQAVHDGVIAGTAFAPRAVRLRAGFTRSLAPAPAGAGLEMAFVPDPCVWDGRFANNGWLQELPKPLTKLTWDNAAVIAPRTAEALGQLSNGAVIALTLGDRGIEAPVWITPGQPEGTITLHLGYGRTRLGRVADGLGVNACKLRAGESPWFESGVHVAVTGATQPLVSTQLHHGMEGRALVRATTAGHFDEHPHFAHEHDHGAAESLHGEAFTYDGYAWGMAINLNTCIGCNACMTACQAENNIAVVGKREVGRGREMHWIRVDRYYEGHDLDNPTVHHQPIPCMHCEKAPCEVVCPVGATVHSSEGLNDMVYNRCVGTRYCSNNCPYKVRRFNFFQYTDQETPSLKMQRNPDVTVRMRGVMEKCTYCVQRINAARITAKKEDRPIRDGEIVTACQQACPTQAIVFGDINDPNSRVSKLKQSPLNYSLLGELNTRPRTTYLAKVRNPNPDLEPHES